MTTFAILASLCLTGCDRGRGLTPIDIRTRTGTISLSLEEGAQEATLTSTCVSTEDQVLFDDSELQYEIVIESKGPTLVIPNTSAVNLMPPPADKYWIVMKKGQSVVMKFKMSHDSSAPRVHLPESFVARLKYFARTPPPALRKLKRFDMDEDISWTIGKNLSGSV